MRASSFEEPFGDKLRREMGRAQIPPGLTGPLGRQLIEDIYAAHEADLFKQAEEDWRRDREDLEREDDRRHGGEDERPELEGPTAEAPKRKRKMPPYPYRPMIQIIWSWGHDSPLIGPYRTEAEAKKEAAKVRKHLRAMGRSFKQVRVHLGVPPETMWSWLKPEEDRE